MTAVAPHLDPTTRIKQRVWNKKQKWVVHSEPVGSGENAYRYLARYVYRKKPPRELHPHEQNGLHS